MPNLSAVLRHFPGQSILIIGDVILDRYWWGEASRLSPEAPVPVVRKQRSTVRPGGAANTAANLAALGATAHLVGLVGIDREAGELQGALLDCGVAVDFLIAEDARPTTTKTRVIASHQQIVRVDEEDVGAMPGEVEDRAREAIARCLERTSAVVVSDYAKGFLTPSLLRFVTAAAGRAGKRVFVDPKGADYARYQGCFLMKPNRMELSILTGLPARNHEETLAAGSRLSAIMPGTLILVTEGADGMTLFADSETDRAHCLRAAAGLRRHRGWRHRAGHSLPGDFRRCIVPRCHGTGRRSCCHCDQHHGYRDGEIARVGNRTARPGAAQCGAVR